MMVSVEGDAPSLRSATMRVIDRVALRSLANENNLLVVIVKCQM